MSDAETIQLLRHVADALSYQSEIRPRPSRSRESLRQAVADVFDAIKHIREESGE